MSASADARGLKRVCSECGIRFYDLNKRPIVCPSCQTEFTGESKVKGRRGRVAVTETPDKPKIKKSVNDSSQVEDLEIDDDDDDDEIEELDEVSLDDVASMEDDDDDDDETAGLEDLDDIDDLDDDDDDLSAGIDSLDDDLEDDLGDVKITSDD